MKPFYACLFLGVCQVLIAPRGAAGQETFEESLRRFENALTNDMYASENDCSSSWGISMVLDLVRPGTGGVDATLEQLCDIVGLCGPEQELLWNDTATQLITAYDGTCLSEDDEGTCYERLPTVQVANSVWIDTSAQLNPSYHAIVGDYLHQTDFSSDLAGGVVNDWVNMSTLGLIDSILPEGPIPFNLTAINSIYFKAAWESPFYEGLTNTDLFYMANRTSIDSHFMHQENYFPYTDSLLKGFQVVQLPYASSDLSMIIALPLNNDTGNVDSDQVVSILPDLSNRLVDLGLPKFTFESEYKDNLKESLISIGLSAPFFQGFCGLFEGSCQVVDLVIQKTFIEVNEEGTVAAAVTAIGLDGAAPPTDEPILFLADHPFQFFIYDSGHDLILFEGQVGAPTIPEGSTAPSEAKNPDVRVSVNNARDTNADVPSSACTVGTPFAWITSAFTVIVMAAAVMF